MLLLVRRSSRLLDLFHESRRHRSRYSQLDLRSFEYSISAASQILERWHSELLAAQSSLTLESQCRFVTASLETALRPGLCLFFFLKLSDQASRKKDPARSFHNLGSLSRIATLKIKRSRRSTALRAPSCSRRNSDELLLPHRSETLRHDSFCMSCSSTDSRT